MSEPAQRINAHVRCGLAQRAPSPRWRGAPWGASALALLVAVALAGCGPSNAGTTTTTVAPTPTWASAASAPGVSTAATPGWSQYRDPTYGYVAEFPSDATINVTPAQGATSLTSWRFANAQGGSDVATLEVTATTHPSAALCAQATKGQAVTLAGGVTGYQQDNLSDTASSSSTNQPQIAVIITHNGLFTIITLTGQPPSNTFMQRWGADWSHILSAFQPGQGPTSANPCG